MQVETAAIDGPLLITPRRFEDARGFFSEIYRRDLLVAAGITEEFVQENHSFSVVAGVVRGLHFQIPPHAQGKLVRVTRGAVLDVAVDIRVGSPSFGRHIAVEVSAANWRQVWIPAGFAHGFCTLEPDTEVVYKVTNFYNPASDKGLLWNDPDLGIAWPVAPEAAILSDKDRRQPRLAELPAYFRHS